MPVQVSSEKQHPCGWKVGELGWWQRTPGEYIRVRITVLADTPTRAGTKREAWWLFAVEVGGPRDGRKLWLPAAELRHRIPR